MSDGLDDDHSRWPSEEAISGQVQDVDKLLSTIKQLQDDGGCNASCYYPELVRTDSQARRR